MTESQPVEDAGREPSKRDYWAIGIVVVFVVMPLLANAVRSLPYYEPVIFGFDPETAVRMILLGLEMCFFAGIAIAVGKDKLKEYGIIAFDWKRDLGHALWLAPVIWVGGSAIGEIVWSFSQFSGSGEGVSWGVHSAPWWMILLTLLSTALGEEIAMRGVLLTRLQNVLRHQWAAILVSTAFFTSYHIYQGWASMPQVFFMGVAFALVFTKSRSLWLVTLTHFGVNAMSEGYSWVWRLIQQVGA